jgi:uncharacterized protein (TIGR03435 family)
MRTDSRELLAVGIFGGNSRLGDRIEMLLCRGRTFSPHASATGVAASAVALGALMLACSLAPRWIAFAQQPARPSFEVASIKPGDPTSRDVSTLMRPGGRYTAANATLQMLLSFAYDVRPHQISGAPSWIDSARFDIDARAGSATPVPDGLAGAPKMRLMVQSLLADRFKLAVHRETREERIYELVVEKGGSRLKEATDTLKGPQTGLQTRRGQIIAMASPMLLLVNQLSQWVGRSVIDKTGLTGKYDFTLKWRPDPGPFGGEPDGPYTPPSPDPSGPSIFTALEEDLGLRLQSAKGLVEVLIIDHVEKPDAN